VGSSEGRSAATPKGLLAAVIGYAGLAMCLTLVYLGMRAVMDVGGSCADGGPYVSSQSCPEGSTLALMGGIFAGIGFAFLATIGGTAVGGIWAGAPFMAWAALFGSLGWNFLDYGVFNAPPEYGIDGGALICGVVFWIMAAGGLVPLLALLGAKPSRATPSAGSVTVLPGPGQPPRRPVTVRATGMTIVSEDGHTFAYPNTDWGNEVPDEVKAKLLALEEQLERSGTSAGTAAGREELARIASDFGQVIVEAMAETPVVPGAAHAVPGPAPADPGAAPAVPGPAPEPEPEFTEGTQALLDRLERLADMRDRGLLGADEYETAKATIMAELEGRS